MINIKRICFKLFFIVLVAGLSIAALFFYCSEQFIRPLPVQGEQAFVIKQGDSVYSVAIKLEQDGLIEHAWLYRLHAKITGSTVIRKGSYTIIPEDNIQTLHTKFVHGDTTQFPIQFIEGKRFTDMLSVVESTSNIKRKLKGLEGSAILKLINPDTKFTHPEGLFYPDTYFYEAYDTDIEILRQAHLKLLSVLAQEWEKRAPNLPYENSYEALIMASIIEKETGVGAERPEISGVFVRRLQKRMRLETDPTVIYGMGEEYKGNIRKKDLLTKTPYNTYRINGLPPTPIALVGREAIHAALNPAQGDALFFVAKGDGSHHFSVTLAEHNAAVRKYQHKRKENYTSTPALSELENNLEASESKVSQ